METTKEEKMKGRYLVTISTEEDIEDMVFQTAKKGRSYILDQLDRRLPEEMQTYHLEELFGDDDEFREDAASLTEDEREHFDELLRLYCGKEKMDYTSPDDSLYISPDKVLYRDPDGDTIFNARIVDLQALAAETAA